MNNNPRMKIEMGPHTDAIGSDADNLRLSQARAQAYVNYLNRRTTFIVKSAE